MNELQRKCLWSGSLGGLEVQKVMSDQKDLGLECFAYHATLEGRI